MTLYDVRVELDGPSGDELRAQLSGPDPDPARWLSELAPRVGTTADGRAAVELQVPGQDVWTSALTAMAVLRQLDYELLAVHVESRPERRRRG